MSEDTGKTLIEQMTEAVQAGNFEGGLALAQQAVEANPKDSEAFVLKGICEAQLRQNDAAVSSFRQAISLSPYNAKAYFNLAVHYYQMDHKAEALNMATEAANIDVKHGGARKLIEQIRSEMAAANQPKPTPNPMDPLSFPQEPAAPTPRSETPAQPAPAQPSVFAEQPQPAAQPRPFETSQPVQPTVNYPRQGYGAGSNEPGLPFVANMGGAWVAIAWMLALCGLVSCGGTVALMSSNFAAFADPAQAQQAQAQLQSNPSAMFFSLLGYAGWLGGLVWTILDIVNRRGNYVWLVPQALCGCAISFITLPIYLLAGRKG